MTAVVWFFLALMANHDIGQVKLGGELFANLKLFSSPPRTDLEVLDVECCPQFCSLSLSRFDVLFYRSKLWTQLDKADLKKLKGILKSAVADGVAYDNGNPVLSFRVNGKQCCLKLMSLILHVGVDKIVSWSDDLSRGVRSTEHGNTGTVKLHKKTVSDIIAVSETITAIGQPHPSGNGLMLPAGAIKKDVFMTNSNGRKTPIRLSFIKTYTALDVRFRKESNFLSCNTCSSVSNWIATASLTELEKARKVQRAHWLEIQQERVALASLDTKSRSQPFEILLLKGDGMSRLGTKLPCLPERAKRITDTSRQTCDVFGWQMARRGVNGHEFSNLFYINPFNAYSCPLNYYVSSLVHTLVKAENVPPVLYLVLDSASVNKSQFLHGSLAFLLLKFPSLEKIVCLHATVGHTHNSIDGAFGQIRRIISREEIFSPQKLAAVACEVGSSEAFMPVVYDFKKLLNETLTGIKNRCSQFGFELTRTRENVYLSGFKSVLETLNIESDRQKLPIFKSKTHMENLKKSVIEFIKPNVEAVKKSVRKIFETCDLLIPDEEKKMLREMVHDVESLNPGPFESLLSSVTFAEETMTDEAMEEDVDSSPIDVQTALKEKGYHVSSRGQHKKMVLVHGDECENEDGEETAF